MTDTKRTWIRERFRGARAIAAAALFLSGYAASELNSVRTFATERVWQAERLPGADKHFAMREKTERSSGVQDGITVHGHWKIEVRNPDGRLAQHREFENSLAAISGPVSLASALGRTSAVGLWVLAVFGSTGPCSQSTFCVIAEPSDSYVGPNVFNNLTVSAPIATTAGTLTLAGTFTVQSPTAINSVSTDVGRCTPTVAPASCTLDYFHETAPILGDFTGAVVSPAINVTLGQLVQVTVVLSFS